EDKKKVELALKESEENFRHLIDSSPIMLWMSDDQGVNFISKGLADYAGTGKDAFKGMGWQFVLHPDDLESSKATYLEHYENRTSFSAEVRHLHHDGKYRWVLAVGHPKFNQFGDFDGFFGTVTDIEVQKEAELTLRKSEEYFRYITDTS